AAGAGSSSGCGSPTASASIARMLGAAKVCCRECASRATPTSSWCGAARSSRQWPRRSPSSSRPTCSRGGGPPWESPSPWLQPEPVDSFRSRVPRGGGDWEEAIEFVVAHATSHEAQERCVAALVRKTEILWHLLDCVHYAYVDPRSHS